MAKKNIHSKEEEESKTPNFLTKGSKVEHWSLEDGFQNAWFPATVVGRPSRTNETVSVRYEHIMNEETGGLLVEKVRVSNLRPSPPEERDQVLEPNDVVDAFHKEVWWTGYVVKIVDDMYTVAFKDPPDVLELPRSDLRVHLDWVDNSKWVRPQKEETTTSNLFTLGMEIEFDYSDKPGTVWLPAFYLGKVKTAGSNFHYVKSRNSKEIRQVLEVDISRIRPLPPKTKCKDNFELLEKVDAFCGTFWSVGVITKILVRKRYSVTFRHDTSEMEFDHSKLRPHIDWNNGQWVTSNTEIPSVSPCMPCGNKDGTSRLTSKQVDQTESSPLVEKSLNKEKVISDDKLAENIIPPVQSPLVEKSLNKAKVISDDKLAEEVPLKKNASAQKEVGRMENHNALSAEKRKMLRKSRFVMEDNGKTDHAIEGSQMVVKPKEVIIEKPSVERNNIGMSCEQGRLHVLLELPNENLQGNGTTTAVDACEVPDSQARLSPSDDQDISSTKNVNDSGNTEVIDTPSTPFVKSSPVWKFLKATEEFIKYPQNPHFRPLIECDEKYREGTALGHMVNYANLIEKTSRLSKNDSREDIMSFLGELSWFEELGFDVEAVRGDLNKLLKSKVESEKLDLLNAEIGQCTEEVVEINKEINELNGKRKLLESKVTERKCKIAKLSKQVLAIQKSLGLCVGE